MSQVPWNVTGGRLDPLGQSNRLNQSLPEARSGGCFRGSGRSRDASGAGGTGWTCRALLRQQRPRRGPAAYCRCCRPTN